MSSPGTLVAPATVHGRRVRAARTTGLFYLALAITGGVGFLLVRPALFAPGSPAETLARLIDQERLARIGIALEMYRREHGRWPKSLDELAPRWLPALPVDRINGGPLGYRIVDGRPVVDSLGVDSDDDGGRLPTNCPGQVEKYRVSAPYEIPAKTTEWMQSVHDGDWVMWTLN